MNLHKIIMFHCYIPKKASYYFVDVDTENENVDTSSSCVQNTPTVSGIYNSYKCIINLYLVYHYILCIQFLCNTQQKINICTL